MLLFLPNVSLNCSFHSIFYTIFLHAINYQERINITFVSSIIVSQFSFRNARNFSNSSISQ